MAIKMNKDESVFRNELICTINAKSIKIEYTLVNLFMLLRYNGHRPRQLSRGRGVTQIEISHISNALGVLERENKVIGYSENIEAIEPWIRNNFVDMAFRGRIDKEKLASLRPVHLESYRVRNASIARDYFSAEQIYLMLKGNSKVRNDLKQFLISGWDLTTDSLTNTDSLDIDSLGMLNLIPKISPRFVLDSPNTLDRIEPLLSQQAELFCDDIRRLLVYKDEIPRTVLVDYLKTIISFHLSLYIQKLVHFLPEMIAKGTTDVEDGWNIVIDTTDDFESKVSEFAIEDADKLYNSIHNYIVATFKINMTLEYLDLNRDNSDNLEKVLKELKKNSAEKEIYFRVKYNGLYKDLDEEDKLLVDDITKYEETYFDKYLALILNTKSKRQLKEYKGMLANLSQNNSDRGFMAQGRSKRHPRRFVMGTRLLETLVQIMVLESQDDHFITRSLSIEELMNRIRERYGLIINGITEPRFRDANVNTHLAFKENVEAFKQKLRQIGFYDDLSDAYILQKVRPRYQLNQQ
ncbi:hypothetical protein GCM10007962_31090 [Yeosuana aromativorans]|uniref:Uncharacterized protein n=1 Tax=Yeosuana aromativorans TaxID=288019 RepID=A0A8J3BPU7_9FLAO|nr:hypothetical protein [Yeosuana aromativorans]GGK34451.1 hypothetical protein GCM10007962_31090 [Yeosuana aromativorans]